MQASVGKTTIAALKRLVSLFGLGQILGGMGDFLESGFVTPVQAGLAREAQYQVLRELRPDAVALVDAFAIPDYVLDSSLGRFDGDVYRQDLPKEQPNAEKGLSDYGFCRAYHSALYRTWPQT